MAEKEVLYFWKRLSGKYHHRTEDGGRLVVMPGELFQAPKDKFTGDNTWQLFDPVDEAAADAELKDLKFKKILVGAGQYDVIGVESGRKLNTTPMTKKEADELINATLDGK